MLRQGVLLAFFFAVLNVTLSAPAETITPVDLYHRCFHVKDSDKSPVLLIHGMTASLETWNGVMEKLAIGTGRRVCAVDLRDHGNSPRTGRIDVEALTVDIGHFLDKKGIKKVNLIGHSLGAKVAVHFTLNNPERVDSMVSEDMRPNGITEEVRKQAIGKLAILKAAVKSIPEGASEDEAREALSKFFNEILGKLGEKVSDEDIKNLRIRQVNGKWEWQANMDALDKAMQDFDSYLTTSTGEYSGPTLFIYGTKSAFDVAGDKENIMKLFPNAKLVPVEGAVHGLHENYRQFTDAVINMLNQLD